MKSLTTLLATALALLTVRRAEQLAAWRAASLAVIQQAVLNDMLEDLDSGFAGSEPALRDVKTVCVGLSSSLNGDRSDKDPSADVLAALRSPGRRILPVSNCSSFRHHAIDPDSGALAVVIFVGQPEWVSRDFTRIRGGWILGVVDAAGWSYSVSVSASDGRWHVDSAKPTWFS